MTAQRIPCWDLGRTLRTNSVTRAWPAGPPASGEHRVDGNCRATRALTDVDIDNGRGLSAKRKGADLVVLVAGAALEAVPRTAAWAMQTCQAGLRTLAAGAARLPATRSTAEAEQ